MKVAILSDFHLGYERFAQDAFEQAQSAMAQAAEQADALLLAGDLFDTKLPRPEALSQAFSIFRLTLLRKWGAKISAFSARDGRKQACDAPIVAIHGTHEMRAKALMNPIQVLEAGGFLLNAHSASVVFEKDGEKVAITGLGGVPERQAKDAIDALKPEPVPGAYNIFVFHQTLSDFIPARGEAMSAEDLPEGFDLYVCGHMHAHSDTQIAGKRILIPGSTVVTQLRKDEEAGKGFYLFDTKTRSAEFMRIQSRPFIFRELRLDGAKPEEAEAAARKEVEDALSSAKGPRPIVRLRLVGTLSQPHFFDTFALEREFEGRAFLLIDKALASGDLKARIEQIRALRESSQSLREMGAELLLERLKKNGVEPTPEIQELVELLSSEKRGLAEEALKRLIAS